VFTAGLAVKTVYGAAASSNSAGLRAYVFRGRVSVPRLHSSPFSSSRVVMAPNYTSRRPLFSHLWPSTIKLAIFSAARYRQATR